MRINHYLFVLFFGATVMNVMQYIWSEKSLKSYNKLFNEWVDQSLEIKQLEDSLETMCGRSPKMPRVIPHDEPEEEFTL